MNVDELEKIKTILRQRREELKDDGRVEGPGAPPPYPAAANAIARRKQVDELMTRYRRGGCRDDELLAEMLVLGLLYGVALPSVGG